LERDWLLVSVAVERLEHLEQAQAKIVLSFIKDRRATISSVDHMIKTKPACCPRGILRMSSVYHTATWHRNGEK
jgi:hypothetical protein